MTRGTLATLTQGDQERVVLFTDFHRAIAEVGGLGGWSRRYLPTPGWEWEALAKGDPEAFLTPTPWQWSPGDGTTYDLTVTEILPVGRGARIRGVLSGIRQVVNPT